MSSTDQPGQADFRSILPEDVVLPGGTAHFHWAKSGEYVTQVTATGPISLTYVNPQDDPRS